MKVFPPKAGVELGLQQMNRRLWFIEEQSKISVHATVLTVGSVLSYEVSMEALLDHDFGVVHSHQLAGAREDLQAHK